MTIRGTTIAAFGLGWLLAFPATGLSQNAGNRPPEVGALAATGRATMERFGKQAASWTATTHLQGGARIVAEVIAAPTMRRTILSMEVQGQRREVLRIIERDGTWYVTEGPNRARFRPYEAPFSLPTAYFFLGRAEPRFIVEGIKLGTFEGIDGGIATYRTPLEAPLRQQAANTLRELEQGLRQHPDRAVKPETKQVRERLRDILENGVANEVEVATGMVVRFGGADRQTELQDFRWLDRIPPLAFLVGGTRWEDFTDDPTAGGTDDLVMIGHSGTWRPGTKAGDTDGRLVDLRTGRFRRIPFQGMLTLPGCFLQGRTRVAVIGVEMNGGSFGLYEVDLKTGASRRLGGELLSSGFTLMPALSPDGRTLAVLHKGAAERVLETQVCLVDVESGEARTLGTPHDMAFPSWLPDGKGLILLNRELADPSDQTGPRTAVISRMDLEGRITRIRQGDMPVLLNDGKTILFMDRKARTWLTCGLDGGDARPYAGGLKGYAFPTPAPDGKRILMMHVNEGGAPEPTILPVGGNDGKRAFNVPGLWVTPAWR